MKIITVKGNAGSGKTKIAMDLAGRYGKKILFISTELSIDVARTRATVQNVPIMVFGYATEIEKLHDFKLNEFDCVVLDNPELMSSSPLGVSEVMANVMQIGVDVPVMIFTNNENRVPGVGIHLEVIEERYELSEVIGGKYFKKAQFV